MNRLRLLLIPALATMLSSAHAADTSESSLSTNVSRGYSIPMLDLTRHDELFSVVERRETYLGHPSAVLFRDGRSLLVAYPDGHGRGNLILRRSTNAAASWEPVKIAAQRVEETPILYRLDLPGGGERVLLVTCRPNEHHLCEDRFESNR